ncbi:MAG TPA: DUF1345 domain-containing protein [Gordonia sp. (in: high G+C Gram-positive bacteria)]|uniref:DUF1345 domain-containing protein n=1 Tax=unclassified Gordonia (in: high G+C Gram-positive bacteria) TaxID=2657482 RepID=UPI0025C0EE76|nr:MULTISPECIES: DUF1345 domain-containing protein [unclassified Gordonia (in: high G+C Gram-positive bacteria)]HNP56142.1 DUF1345 domain-containing protein [Gordonia sp. (in: high G+C Gram-positive bacteria)]HRC50601.1 DUF1345 domain-containing protein [Gordonia sp. (in: high G+C Gram-positive bacteria)]
MSTAAVQRLRNLSALGRVLYSAAIGGLIAVGLWIGWRVEVRLSFWIAAATVLIILTWVALGPMDAEETEAHAQRRDITTPWAVVIVVIATLFSLTSVIVVLFRHGDPWMVFGTIVAVVTSWTAIHTLFAGYYSRLYFTNPIGGIDFNQDEPPVFTDFAYVAFTIGMGFTVSDTALSGATMRRAALIHALLSFLFGTVILALVINLIGSLSP